MRSMLARAALAASALSVIVAGQALAAECINASKKADAGQKVTVLVDVATDEVSFTGANAAGRLPGGFADVWLDFDGDGTGDLKVLDDTFIVRNHSFRDVGEPFVLPPIVNGNDPAGPGRGVDDGI